MSRWVEPQSQAAKLASGTPPSETKDALERVAKYVPGEIVSIYTILVQGFSSASKGPPREVILALAGVFFLATFVYIGRFGPKERASRIAHFIASPFAFVAWAYSVTGTLLGDLFVPWVAIVLMVLSLLVAVLVKPQAP